MSRRRIAAVVVALATVAGSSASQPAAAADDIATVNGESISVDDFDEILTSFGVTTDTVDGNNARGLLTDLIVTEAMRQVVESRGIDPGERAENTPDGPGFEQDRERYQQLLTDVDGLRADYEAASGLLDGQICLQAIGVADAETADEVLAELADGGEFAAVGAEYDPTFATTGGWVSGDPASPCLAAEQLSGAAQPVLDAVADVGAGEPAGPIELQEGFVVVVRTAPFDDVAAGFAAAPAMAAVAEYLPTIDISVNPRYGRWDPATASVVPLGQP